MVFTTCLDLSQLSDLCIFLRNLAVKVSTIFRVTIIGVEHFFGTLTLRTGDCGGWEAVAEVADVGGGVGGVGGAAECELSPCPRTYTQYSTVQYNTSHVSLEVFNSNIKIESMRARLETSAWPPDTNI